MPVKIYLTFDYELFFGDSSGTVEKCMLQPTNDLFKLVEGRDVFYTFFVDVGYLIQAEKYPELTTELAAVKEQIREMIRRGHSVQLHVHPHWEKSTWKNGEWTLNVEGNYKLVDFTPQERIRIVTEYKAYLTSLTQRQVRVFRAGGWCIQPFSELKEALLAAQISIDSSVLINGYLKTSNYNVDFRNAPRKSNYSFENNVCEEVEGGMFTEFPIADYRYRPSFYWMLYGLGRVFPNKHKMIGDGKFLSQGSRKSHVLFNYTNHHVSTDGYFAKKLSAALEKSINLGHEELTIIGHPKGNTVYSLKKLENFIKLNHQIHQFKGME